MIDYLKEVYLQRLRKKIEEQEEILNDGTVNSIEYYKRVFGHRKGLREAEDLFLRVLREMLEPKDKGEPPNDNTRKYY